MRALIFLVFAVLGIQAADATSLRISPVLLDVRGPSPVTGVTLRNDAHKPATVQLRVFRWFQDGGIDRLVPTDDVIVSPPIMTLSPRTEYRARIIRVSKQLLQSEESYRLIVDNLSDQKSATGRTVSFVVRQSIPVFFSPPDLRPASVVWSVARERRAYRVTGTNRSDTRLRVATLHLHDGHGATIAGRDGLVGYVLGHSQMSWSIPAVAASARHESVIKLSAETEAGTIDATALHSGR